MTEDEQRNLEAIEKFGCHWEEHKKFQWHYKSVSIFPCHVFYNMKGILRKVVTTAQVYHDGKIELVEAGWLNVNEHHLGFDYRYQVFSCTRKARLCIEGSSPKVGGAYKIEIFPT